MRLRSTRRCPTLRRRVDTAQRDGLRGRIAGAQLPWRRRGSGANGPARGVRGAAHAIVYGGLPSWVRGWRYPQMPFWTVAPDLSNRWDRLRHLRLFAQGGLAQCCQQALDPGVYKIRVRRYPDPHRTPQAAPNLTVEKGSSEFELLTFLQGRLYALTQDTQASADVGIEIGVTVAETDEFICHVERGYYRNTIQADDLSAIADFSHLRVQELGRIKQVGAFLDRAGNVVLLFEYSHADPRLIVAHACSMDFKRPIMASTRPRTCSFFCKSVARSEVRVSWRCRGARFSSLI